MIPILNFNGGMNLVGSLKKWVDVVGEVMWSVGSYLGALGDDPLHPIPLFYYFKNQGETTTPFFQLRWLVKLKKGSSGFPWWCFSFSRNFPFFTIFGSRTVFRANRWSGKAGNRCIGKSAFFSLKWCIFYWFLINFFFTIFSNNALLKSDTTFLSWNSSKQVQPHLPWLSKTSGAIWGHRRCPGIDLK